MEEQADLTREETDRAWQSRLEIPRRVWSRLWPTPEGRAGGENLERPHPRLPEAGGVGLRSPVTAWALGLLVTYLVAAHAWAVLLRSPGLPPGGKPPSPLVLTPLMDSETTFLEALERTDVPHFLNLAQSGYHPGDPQVAFHPVYPMAVRLVSLATFGDRRRDHLMLSALLVSGLAALAVVCLLNSLCRRYLSEAGRRLCLLLWVLNPTAFFLAMAYTEAPYLALTLGSLVLAHRGRWVGSGLLMGLACLTRPVGVLAYLALIVYWAESRPARSERHSAWGLLGLALPLLSLGGYTLWQALALGDPLAMIHAEQRGWGQSLALPWSFVDSLASAMGGTSIHVYDYALQVGLHIALLALSIVLTGRLWGLPGMPLAFKAYVLLTLLSIVLRDTDMSISRFLMAAFPLHMTLADWLAKGPQERALLVVLGSLVVNVLGTVTCVTGRSFF